MAIGSAGVIPNAKLLMLDIVPAHGAIDLLRLRHPDRRSIQYILEIRIVDNRRNCNLERTVPGVPRDADHRQVAAVRITQSKLMPNCVATWEVRLRENLVSPPPHHIAHLQRPNKQDRQLHGFKEARSYRYEKRMWPGPPAPPPVRHARR